VYKIDVKKLGQQRAQEITRRLYSALKEDREFKTEEGITKLFDGVVYLDKKNQELSADILKEVKKLNDNKKIALLKEKDAYYLIEYQGEYSEPLPLKDVKDKIIARLSEEKKEELSKKLLNKIKEKLKKESIEKIISEYNPKIETVKDEKLQILSAKYGLSNEAIKDIFKVKESQISQPFIARGGVVLVLVEKKTSPSEDEMKKNVESIYSIVESEKFNTYIQMYIDKLKKESDIRVNPRVVK